MQAAFHGHRAIHQIESGFKIDIAVLLFHQFSEIFIAIPGAHQDGIGHTVGEEGIALSGAYGFHFFRRAQRHDLGRRKIRNTPAKQNQDDVNTYSESIFDTCT